ncbi:MAG: RidA family protein [Sphingobium sp.]
MDITRLDRGTRMSQAVIHSETVYLAGQVAEPGANVVKQTRTVLANIDALLERTGSSREHLLSATIWLADISDFAAMNNVWDEWVAGMPAPVRATVEARLATPEYKVEIMIIAAKA